MEKVWQHVISRDGVVSTITLSGELDISGSDQLTQVLVEEVNRDGVVAVQADLTGVRFIDSTAITALVHAYRAAHEHGGSFTVTGAHGHVRRVLGVSGVLPALTEQPGTAPVQRG